MDEVEIQERLTCLGEIVVASVRLEFFARQILANLIKGHMEETMRVIAPLNVRTVIDRVSDILGVWEPGSIGDAVGEWVPLARRAVTMRNRVVHGTFSVDPTSSAFWVPPRAPEMQSPRYVFHTRDALDEANRAGQAAFGAASEHRTSLDPMQIPEVRETYWRALGLTFENESE